MAPDLFYVIYYLLCLVWLYKVQILAGLFVSLTVFEYFYRHQLKLKRNKQKRILHEIIVETLKIRGMGDFEFTDAEHHLLKKMVENIEEKLDISQRATRTQISSEFDVVNIRLDAIDKKSEIALSKISILEKDTDFIRAFKKYKLIFLLAIIGLVSTTNFEQLKVWFLKLNPFR